MAMKIVRATLGIASALVVLGLAVDASAQAINDGTLTIGGPRANVGGPIFEPTDGGTEHAVFVTVVGPAGQPLQWTNLQGGANSEDYIWVEADGGVSDRLLIINNNGQAQVYFASDEDSTFNAGGELPDAAVNQVGAGMSEPSRVRVPLTLMDPATNATFNVFLTAASDGDNDGGTPSISVASDAFLVAAPVPGLPPWDIASLAAGLLGLGWYLVRARRSANDLAC